MTVVHLTKEGMHEAKKLFVAVDIVFPAKPIAQSSADTCFHGALQNILQAFLNTAQFLSSPTQLSFPVLLCT